LQTVVRRLQLINTLIIHSGPNARYGESGSTVPAYAYRFGAPDNERLARKHPRSSATKSDFHRYSVQRPHCLNTTRTNSQHTNPCSYRTLSSTIEVATG
jgi:hypothetical protein